MDSFNLEIAAFVLETAALIANIGGDAAPEDVRPEASNSFTPRPTLKLPPAIRA